MGDEYPRQFKLGTMLPMGGLIFNSLANRFIRRDEKLVRDSDRMRYPLLLQLASQVLLQLKVEMKTGQIS